MTVVPCLADQPRRTGRPRQTGEPPEPEEGAVLVRERLPNQPIRRSAPPGGPESAGESAPQPRDRAKLAQPVEEPRVGSADEQAKLLPPGGASAQHNSSARPPGKTALPESPRPAAAVQHCEANLPRGTVRPGGIRRTGPAQPGEAPDAAASAAAKPNPAVSNSAASTAPQPAEPNHPADPLHPDREHPTRVRVVVDWDPFSRPPRRVATRDEMAASAHRVLARREHGRHRKPDTRDPWTSRAADFVVAWAATLRMALLILAGTAFLAGLVLMNSPVAGVAVTSVTLAAGVAAGLARPRKSPSHRC